MTKKTGIVLFILISAASVLFFLPNSVSDFLFPNAHNSSAGLRVIKDVYGRVEKTNERAPQLVAVTSSSGIQSGDTFYTHSDSKILFGFSSTFWLMPHSKMEFVRQDERWTANLVYGDVKKVSEANATTAQPAVDIVFASEPINTDTFSSYEFDPIEIDVKTGEFKDFAPDSTVPQNILEKQIFETLSLHKKKFEGCLIRYYKKTNGNFGSSETVFELNIDITGNIATTRIVRSDINDEEYKKCLRTVLDRVRFRNLPLKEPMIALFPLSIEMH